MKHLKSYEGLTYYNNLNIEELTNDFIIYTKDNITDGKALYLAGVLSTYDYTDNIEDVFIINYIREKPWLYDEKNTKTTFSEKYKLNVIYKTHSLIDAKIKFQECTEDFKSIINSKKYNL